MGSVLSLDQLKMSLLSTVLPLQPSRMSQNYVNVGVKLMEEELFLIDPWSIDQADPV